MCKMSEDEAIEILKDFKKRINTWHAELVEEDIQAIETILDLYNKEKEKNKELSQELTERICKNVEAEVFEEMRLELKQEKEKNKELEKENWIMRTVDKQYISKDKIRAKIKSLEEKIHVVIPNEYNKIEVMNEFKNEGAVNILKELLEEE